MKIKKSPIYLIVAVLISIILITGSPFQITNNLVTNNENFPIKIIEDSGGGDDGGDDSSDSEDLGDSDDGADKSDDGGEEVDSSDEESEDSSEENGIYLKQT